MTERDLFLQVLEIADPSERAAILERECAENPALRQGVEALLAAAAAAGQFLNQPHPAAAQGDSDKTRDYQSREQLGAVIAGRYKLLEAIGEGGMGEVWVAEQTEPVKRKVALKVIKPGMDSKGVLARFEAERQALALMDHPNIAKVLDGGLTDQGRPYFVMEYVKGVPITEYCDSTRLTVPQRLELFVQVCQAVQHAHQKGIIHRDLKPSNILVAPYDDRPVPKVIDFGLAKAMHQSLTERTLHTAHEAVLGTPLYMSPEQAHLNNLDVDTRSDIYSLGVLLYELLTGTTPLERKRFKKAAWDEVRRLIREEEPPRPSTRLSSTDTLPSLAACRRSEPLKLTKQIRGELDWITMKALEKDRTRRYETANGFAADVLRYLSGEAVQAHPPSASYRFKKFVRRNRGQVIAASLVLFALLAGIAGTTWGLMQAKEQERIVREESAAREQARAEEQIQREKAESAAKAEKEAKEQTQKRLTQIEKGVALFAGMLKGINPRSEGLGKPTLYEQLRLRAENAADQLDAEAVGDPEALARLQTILGDTLRELGNATKAIEVLEKARAIRERELGAEHPDTLDTFNELALAYEDAGNLDQAVELHKQVRDASIRNHGAQHLNTLVTLGNLAGTYYRAGRFSAAIDLYEQVRDVQLKKLSARDPYTLATLQNLALAYMAVGRLSEAIALFEQVRDTQVKRLGPEHIDTLRALHNLATAYQEGQRLPDAIKIYEQVRDARSRKLGAEHHDTLTTGYQLAGAYHVAGRLPEAIDLFNQVKDAQGRTLGADHPSTLMTVNDLAMAYEEVGRLPEAIDLYEQTRKGFVKKLGADNPNSINVLGNLGGAYARMGQGEKAVSMLTEFVAWRRKLYPDHPVHGNMLASVALELLNCEQYVPAEEMLRECLAIRQKTRSDDWVTFNTQSMLGGTLLGQKEYAEAEPLLLAGYEGMKAREKTIPPQGSVRIPEALDRLIVLYTATNKPDEVKKWQAERAKYPAKNQAGEQGSR